ncbi:MAG: transcription elongation factor GreB [Polyangiaceae bacterium]|nr:transcription elongation factor GreB [Polyangiaceae bacterium]
MTPEGARTLSDELARLRSQRPKVVQEVADAAAQGDRSENAEYIYGKKKLREIDRRMYFLTHRLKDAVVVDPKEQRGDKVFFGATVTVEDEDGVLATYRIVGEDEVGANKGDISFKSPIGRALIGKKLGETIIVHRPSGEVEITIVTVKYV